MVPRTVFVRVFLVGAFALGIAVEAAACGGPEFSTQTGPDSSSDVRDTGPEVLPPLVCVHCDDPGATAEAGSGGDDGDADARGEGELDDATVVKDSGPGGGADAIAEGKGSEGAADGPGNGRGSGADADAGCGAGYSICHGGCSQLSSDTRNCGACGNDCAQLPNVSAAGLACVLGRCSYQCAAGYGDCTDAGTGCGASLESTSNCGACGAACASSAPLCTLSDAGRFGCTPACPLGTTGCGTSCTNVMTDRNNCGACGTACAVGTRCSVGHCVCDTTSGCSGCCSSATTCEPYASQSSTSCGTGGGACGPCTA